MKTEVLTDKVSREEYQRFESSTQEERFIRSEVLSNSSVVQNIKKEIVESTDFQWNLEDSINEVVNVGMIETYVSPNIVKNILIVKDQNNEHKKIVSLTNVRTKQTVI